MTNFLLQTEAITKRYGALLVTDQVSLDVREGELHAIIGPNGAGKTTLISTLAGLVLFAQGDPGDVWHAQVNNEAPSLRRGFGGVIEKLWGSL